MTTRTKLFEFHSVDEHADSLANYLPSGCVFEGAKTQGTNVRALLRGLARELFQSEDYIKSYTEEYLPDCSILLIDEWESALGIPDSCFSGTGTVDDRRRDVLTKLASLGIQTVEDFENLADVFGIEVTIVPGLDSGVFSFLLPYIFFATSTEARFTIVVAFQTPSVERFTYTFPVNFGGFLIGILECLFRKQKPANCNIIFQET